MDPYALENGLRSGYCQFSVRTLPSSRPVGKLYPVHYAARSAVDMAFGFPIRHGSGTLGTGLWIDETAYKTGQHGSRNRGAGRPYAPGRIGPVFVPAPPAPSELPDVRYTDPASAASQY